MTLAEGLVLMAAAILVAVVFVEAGTITPRVGVLLLTLAMLATAAALLHMSAW